MALETVLGHYRIIREIARSNDAVYEAVDTRINRRVAIKELMMPPGATDAVRQDRIARFQREARAAGSLTHPNIVTIFETEEENGRYFIVMEYLEGDNLRQKMDREGSLPPEEAVRIATQVLDGLAHAHSKGVIHRDIKPENIHILPTGLVKITDFGIARLKYEPNLTMDGQIFGTPSYMSPEQVQGGAIDERSDLFSVGIILYEMLAGYKPFQGDSVITITYNIVHTEPPSPPNIPAPLEWVIRRALRKSPARAVFVRAGDEAGVGECANAGESPARDCHADGACVSVWCARSLLGAIHRRTARLRQQAATHRRMGHLRRRGRRCRRRRPRRRLHPAPPAPYLPPPTAKACLVARHATVSGHAAGGLAHRRRGAGHRHLRRVQRDPRLSRVPTPAD
jgi:serine/threonine protein kinase